MYYHFHDDDDRLAPLRGTALPLCPLATVLGELRSWAKISGWFFVEILSRGYPKNRWFHEENDGNIIFQTMGWSGVPDFETTSLGYDMDGLGLTSPACCGCWTQFLRHIQLFQPGGMVIWSSIPVGKQYFGVFEPIFLRHSHFLCGQFKGGTTALAFRLIAQHEHTGRCSGGFKLWVWVVRPLQSKGQTEACNPQCCWVAWVNLVYFIWWSLRYLCPFQIVSCRLLMYLLVLHRKRSLELHWLRSCIISWNRD